MAVARRVRFEVLRRDGHRCRYCGATAEDAKLTVDHVVPQALGGTDEPSNLVTACEPCNNGKASVPADAPIVEAVADDAMRWAAAMKQAAENSHAAHQERLAYREAFRTVWETWGVTSGRIRTSVPLDAGWEHSIDNFREAGLPEWELAEGITVAMTRNKIGHAAKFKYFCGICWTKVRKLQADAKAIVGGVPVPHPVDHEVEEEREGWPIAMRPTEGALFDRWAALRAEAGEAFTEDQAFNAAWQIGSLIGWGVSASEVDKAIGAAATFPWPVRLAESLGNGMESLDAWLGLFHASARLLNAEPTMPWTAEETMLSNLDILRTVLTHIVSAIDEMTSRAETPGYAEALGELGRSFSEPLKQITKCLPDDFPDKWREENYVENPFTMWWGWWNRRQHPED